MKKVVIIGLIAWFVRLTNLTYHSLWFDEAMSVHWARQTIPRILEVGFTLVEDRLPPLYYLLLKGWAIPFGFSEWSVRLLPVLFGWLLLPLVFSIARQLFNRRIALIAATLIALNPFLIWYSQESRMYAPAVFFGTLAIWAFLPLCTAPQRSIRQQLPTIALFTLAALAALYSHLYAGFLLPALGLWLLISYPRCYRLWLILAGCSLLITLAYLPILLAIWRFSAESVPGEPLTGLYHRAWWLLSAFTVWQAALRPPLANLIPITIALFGLLAYLPRVSGPATIKHPRLLVTLLALSPFVIANFLLLRNQLAFYGVRYFIVMLPWLLLLAAIGADNLGRWLTKAKFTPPALGSAPALLLIFLTILPLPGQWSGAAAKEAWRQSVTYLAHHATAQDGILIHPDWVRYPFQFYFRGPGQTYAAFSNVTAETALDGPLQGVVKDHTVLWLIQSHLDAPDPEQRVEQWLAARYPLVTELYPPGIKLKGYAPGYQTDSLPSTATAMDIEFANGLRLVGFETASSVSATDDLFHPPSGWLHVTLYWQASRPIDHDLAPFVHLIGPQGVWGISLERSSDALKIFPTSRWAAEGPIIRHDMDVNLNPVTPPGLYQLVVGLPDEDAHHILSQVEVH